MNHLFTKICYIAFLFGFCVTSHLLFADKFYLNNGEVLKGKFLGLKNNTYHFQLKDGTKRQFTEEQVDDLQIMANIPDEDGSEPPQEKAEKKNHKKPKSSNWSQSQ